MDTLQNIRPRLIEPGVKYFLSASLEQCHILKNKYNNCLYNLGLFLSFAGMITYKKNSLLRDVAAKCPIDRILVETDAPYLAPEPFRGKRNEPSYVNYTIKTLASALGISMMELENQLWINSNKVLNLPN